MKSIKLNLKDESATQFLGEVFAAYCKSGFVYLQGDLGVGKTCFSQALIRAAGFSGRVKSPTYTLVEPYELAERNIYHFDLYRLQDEEELLFLGCDDYFEAASTSGNTLCLIEWPEKAASILPLADIELRIAHVSNSTSTRKAHLLANTLKGEQILNAMQVELQSI